MSATASPTAARGIAPRPAGERLTPAGERILAAAGTLFYAHGITAVGVDRIAEQAGTTKKTLYDRFGSKSGLINAYLRRRAETWQAFVADHLDRHAPAPGTERVLTVYDALGAWMVHNPRGCGFVNAYAELAGTGHDGLELIRDEKATMRRLYVELLGEAGFEGDRAEALGMELALLHEGATVQLTAGGAPDALDRARDLARRLLSA